MLEVLVRAMRQEKEIEVIQTEKEDIKVLSLGLVYGMHFFCLFIEKSAVFLMVFPLSVTFRINNPILKRL